MSSKPKPIPNCDLCLKKTGTATLLADRFRLSYDISPNKIDDPIPKLYISFRIPGVWVECVRCKKWRHLEDNSDPSELAEDWHCGLQAKFAQGGASTEGACNEPESIGPEVDESQFIYGEFGTGSVVLAKMTGKICNHAYDTIK